MEERDSVRKVKQFSGTKYYCYQIKVVFVGDIATGNTSLLQRYVKDDFSFSTMPGNLDCRRKDIEYENAKYRLSLWDIGGIGETRYPHLYQLYCRGAIGAFLVYDITNKKSLNRCQEWKEIIDTIWLENGDPIPTVLIANKIDINQEHYDGEWFSRVHNFANYFKTSAKDGVGIKEAINFMVEKIHELSLEPSPMQVVQKHPPLQTYLKDDKKEEEKLLRKNLNIAKREHGIIPVRFIKLFFTGSGAAGKTSFINLLLKRKFNKDHHSTNVVHTDHAVSFKKAVLHGSTSEVTWTEFDLELEISCLRSLLLPANLATPENPSLATEMLPSQSFTEEVHPSKPLASIDQYKSPKPQQSAIKRWFTGLFVSSVNSSSLSTFDNIIDSESPKHITYQPGEVLSIITLLDTGGQPEYIHLLPTINIYPTVTFVIHDLSKSLGDQVLVEYSELGKHVFTPYHLSYSNLDMIKLLMSAANDSVERPTTNIPQLVTTPGSNKKSYICLVGTHADKVSKRKVVETERELSTLVNMTHCETAVWQTDSSKVLFSVDNTTAGIHNNEDPVANVVRNKIEMLAKEKDIYELPITWMLLELEIRHVCSKREKPYISFRDCVSVAKERRLMTDAKEVKYVLLYHHMLGVLIYFDEIPGLCDYVIIDHQWWFDKLSNIISITFYKTSLDHDAVQKLKYQGLLSKGLLQHVEWKGDIKEEFFLSLLVHMRIIAPVFTRRKEIEEYFIPLILPACDFKKNSKLLDQYGHLQGEPLLVHFQSGILPRGLFCSLIVELLQHPPKGWHPHFSHEGVHHSYSNLISFRLHDGYSLSLLDKVAYLEVQIRHAERESDFGTPVHNRVYNYLVYALTEVCIHLTFDYDRLQYGFVCRCGKGIDNHIAVVPDITPSMHYAECSISSLHLLKLDSSHLVWFSSAQVSLNNGTCTGVEQKVKDHYNDLINLNATAMLPNLYAKRVISLEEKDTISLTKPLERDKMQYLLDKIIVPSLQAGVIQKFELLLEVMEGSEDVVTRNVAQQLATDHNKLSSSSDGHMMVAPLTEGSPNQPAAIKIPAMRLLHEIVIPRIAADWSIVADYLEYEVKDKQAIKERCHQDPERCCVELLEDWLSSDRGVSPKSWSRLIKALKGIKGLTATTEIIIQDLVQAGVVVIE